MDTAYFYAQEAIEYTEKIWYIWPFVKVIGIYCRNKDYFEKILYNLESNKKKTLSTLVIFQGTLFLLNQFNKIQNSI